MVYPIKKVIKIPLTVVTLTNAPNSLRGDLTKWMQEIATGVYVGNFNVKVREKLRSRILENIGDGQATISYAYRNEIGYKFDTINTQRE
ncbi:MAG: type I-E CRISPR-associated endoribonuclease Cas2e, partial [Anaerococcus sp.]